jgi:hypothetical protein
MLSAWSLAWLAAPTVAALLIIAACLMRGRPRRAAFRFATVGVLSALTLAAMHLDASPGGAKAGRDRWLVVGWTDPEVYRRLSDRFEGGRRVTIVAPPAARALASRWFPKAGFEPVDDPSGDGLVAESSLRHLLTRVDRLGSGGEVVLVAPRTRDLAQARRAAAELVRAVPRLRSELSVLRAEDLRLSWPSLVVQAPLTVTPDCDSVPVRLSAGNLPQGCSIELIGRGRRRGSAEPELGAWPVGLDAGKLKPGGPAIKPTAGSFEATGRLQAPEDRRTLTLSARIVSPFGESIGFGRATVTARIQPLGLLRGKSGGPDTALRGLLKNLKLEYREVHLSDDDAADRDALARWRLVVVEGGDLGVEDSRRLREVLGRLDSPPALLFVGASRTAVSRPLEPGEAREIALFSDVSDSMREPAEGRSIRRWDLSLRVAKDINPGVLNRNTNGLVKAYKFNRLEPGAPITDFTPCPIDTYAGTSDEERRNSHWELAHHLIFAAALRKANPKLSDIVCVFDPADVFNGPALPDWAKQAANDLKAAGVRMHLIAAGSLPENARDALGPVVYDSVIATTGWVRAYGGEPVPVGGDDVMIAKIRTYLFQKAFPRLGVAADPKGLGTLRGKGKDALEAFVAAREGSLHLLNALNRYRARADWDAETQGRVALWFRHWFEGGASAPLLVKDAFEIGGGRAVPAFQLLVDLAAENAATEDEFTPERDALAGLFVRILGAISGEWESPTLHFAPRGNGFLFYRADLAPMTIRPSTRPDWSTGEGVGLGSLVLSGHNQGGREFTVDGRSLDAPWLAPRGLDPTAASLVRLVAEDANESIGRLAIDLPLTAPPPWPIVQDVDVRQLGVADAAPTGASPAAPTSWLAPTPPVLSALILAAWLALAVHARRGL